MLAAFPPPSQQTTNTSRGRPTHIEPAGSRANMIRRLSSRPSWFVGPDSWPALQNSDSRQITSAASDLHFQQMSPFSDHIEKPALKPARRCCGMPRWLFITLLVLFIIAIIAAVVFPLLFAFHVISPKKKDTASGNSCAESTSCLNGGVTVVSQGLCTCICTNGFTGTTCDTAGSSACVTANLLDSSGSTQIGNVTLGSAIPQLVASSNDNFSVPLSGTSILAKFNSAGLSCIAQNALVTFNGQATSGDTAAIPNMLANAEEFVSVVAVPPGDNRVVFKDGYRIDGSDSIATMIRADTATVTKPVTLITIKTTLVARSESAHGVVTTKSVASRAKSTSASSRSETDSSNIGDDVLEFARVAVLYILQERALTDGLAAQTMIQRLLVSDGGLASKSARNITIGDGCSVDLVEKRIDIGNGLIGA